MSKKSGGFVLDPTLAGDVRNGMVVDSEQAYLQN